MTNRTRSILLRLAPLFIILIGVLIMALLAKNRQPPTRSRAVSLGPLVEVMAVQSSDRRAVVEGNGTVAPRHEIILQPQVSGMVLSVDPNLVAGGEFAAGDELARIEPVDYELAVEQALAQVAQAEYQLSISRANASVAQREWDLVTSGAKAGDDGDSSLPASPDPLVLHMPQLRQAEANLTSAKAALASAELNLSRTVLRAPFNCRVRRQSISPGQLVGPASQLAVLFNTDLVEIEIGLPLSDLAWLEIPGAPAKITLEAGGDQTVWTGSVDRSVGVIEEISRLARVVVRVKEPFQQQASTAPELAIGSFVTVQIEGRPINQVFPIPRSALHENRTVWIANPDSTLDIRRVQLARMSSTEAYVTSGLNQDEHLILTQISGAAPGMRLRPISMTSGDK